MTNWRFQAKLLLVRAWTESLSALRAALRQAGIASEITRVDTEPALNAALSRTRFHAVVVDSSTPTLSYATVMRRLREHAIATPVVVMTDLASLPAALLVVLQGLPN